MKAMPYKSYLLIALLTILAFNHVDRLALGLVLQVIKVDLDLSDTQLGLLTGIAFALFYSIMGIPIARWADRGNRVAIIGITTVMWSAAVACCALAGSFLQLLMIRVCVAIGEAGCVPPAHSLIADYFPRAERPRAVARYKLGVPLGYVFGYVLAGWLNEFFGWRVMFVMLGLPGLVIAAIAWFSMREPRLQKSIPSGDRPWDDGSRARGEIASPTLTSPSLAQVAATLWANRTFRHLLIGWSLTSFFGYGIAQWKPAFFMRSFGLQTGELGTSLAVIYGVGGLLGTYLGGEWATRYAARNERLQLRCMAVAYCAFGAISAGIYLSATKYMAFGLMGVATIGVAMTTGPLFATLQTLVPAHMRATSIAIIYLFANLIGMGLGPLATGALSDFFGSWAGQESLRYALLSLCPGYLWAACHLWLASRSVSQDLDAVGRVSPYQLGVPAPN